MKKIRKEIIEHKIFYTFILILIIFFIYWGKLPDYKVKNSFKMSSQNYIEDNINIQVYKAFNNPYLYLEIAEDHNRINRKPNKLIIDLYFFKWKYKTVVFDYDENLYYIKLEY